MPRPPQVSSPVQHMGVSVYSSLSKRVAATSEEIYPLHIGDTWMEPVQGCRMEDLRVADHPGMHRYSPVRGLPELIQTIATRVSRRTGLPTQSSQVLVTAGATGGLNAVVQTIMNPGEEILILAPHWPLIAGIVRALHGTPVPVPFFDLVTTPEEAVDTVAKHCSPKTIALYVNTPNNPTGRVIPRAWLQALAKWASQKNLWLLADEVYEDYVYQGEHTWCRPFAPEHCISIHSFSKAYGMAGNRCGYIVGPSEIIEQIQKVSTHTYYNAPTAAQVAANKVLQSAGDRWIHHARQLYADVGKRVADKLNVPHPEGCTFLFINVGHLLDDRGLLGFLEDCADRRLLLAPGPSFGPYPSHVRLCFTAAPPEVTLRAADVLASLLEVKGVISPPSHRRSTSEST